MTIMNNFINIHPSLGQRLSASFEAMYCTHIFTLNISYALIFNDQFGLSTLKVQIDILFIQYKIVSTMSVSICTHCYYFRDIKQTNYLFWPYQRNIFVAKVGFSTRMPENKVFK